MTILYVFLYFSCAHVWEAFFVVVQPVKGEKSDKASEAPHRICTLQNATNRSISSIQYTLGMCKTFNAESACAGHSMLTVHALDRQH